MKNICIGIILVAFACCTADKESDALYKFRNVITENEFADYQLFSENMHITSLETDKHCLLSKIKKLKRYQNMYYIHTDDNKIYIFNNKGVFVNVLDKQGYGPEEYIRVEDFDIFYNNDKAEIWVADNQRIKIFDAETFENKRTIAFSYIIHKFKILNENHLLLLTGNNENIITISDYDGDIIETYLPKEIPDLMFRGVQFIKHNTGYIFQLGISNNFIRIDSITNAYSEGQFLLTSDLLQRDQMLEMFNKSQLDYLREVRENGYVNSVRFFDDKMWIYIRKNDKQYLAKVDSLNYMSKIIEQGVFFETFSFCESDLGMIFYADPAQKYNQDFLKQNQIGFTNNSNPIIIEYIM